MDCRANSCSRFRMGTAEMDVQPIIRKTATDLRVAPNFADYEDERHRFSWEAAARELPAEPGGGINIAWQAVDRQCAGRTDLLHRDHERA